MSHQQGKWSFKPDLRFATMAVCVLLVIVLSLILWLYPNGSIAAISLIVLTAITAIANLGQWLTPTFTPVEAPPQENGSSRPLPTIGSPAGSEAPQPPSPLPVEHSVVGASELIRQQIVPDITVAQKSQPFFFCVHLPGPGELYGRSMARATILSRAYHEGSTSLVGERRIGKTWLLEYTQLVLPSTQMKSSEGSMRSFRVGYLDASSPGCGSVKEFTSVALEALGSSPKRVVGGLEKLEALVRALKKEHCIPVLCIDEFEGFARSREFDLKFFSELRAIANVGLVFVIASRVPLLDVLTDSIGASAKVSPFFNIFEEIKLKPFHKIEAETFAREKSKRVGFTEEECALLLRYGRTDELKEAWPPVRLQLVGKMLLDEKLLEEHNPGHYRPNDPDYWRAFEQQLAEKYRGVIRP